MLLLEEVDHDQFKAVISDPYHVYASSDFNFLNKSKVEKVYYLLFKDSKYRLGIIGGIKNNLFLSPFSAPFGGFVYLHHDVKLQIIEEAIDNLIAWCVEKKLDAIKITLPPHVYDYSFISKLINVYFRQGFETEAIELNYHFETSNLTEDYSVFIWRNAKKNLNISLSSKLTFEECLTDEQKAVAYSIIKLNRELKGKPLRLSLNQLTDTSKVVSSKFFLVKDESGNSIASAVVFIVAKGIVQVIYWGDNPGYAHLKTMNFLSYQLFAYCKNSDFRIVDLGYSTVDSVPNYGLCEFKESVGCEISPKYTFIRKL